MQVICAFLDAKTTMQHIFDKHNATCLLLAQREVNNTTCFLSCQVAHQATYIYDLFPAESLGQALYLDSTLFSEM